MSKELRLPGGYDRSIQRLRACSLVATTRDGTTYSIEADDGEQLALEIEPIEDEFYFNANGDGFDRWVRREFAWKLTLTTTATLKIQTPQEPTPSPYEPLIHRFTRVD